MAVCRGPNRGEYVLDVIVCGFVSQMSCDIVPDILQKDHQAVIVNVDICISYFTRVSREVSISERQIE